jgi:hypothetical protein
MLCKRNEQSRALLGTTKTRKTRVSSNGLGKHLSQTKGKEDRKMARLRLVKYLGQWELHNVTSGKLLASTTEETQKVLRLLALQGGHQFTLEVV